MNLREIHKRKVTVDLMPEDCLLIAQVFRAAVRHDAGPSLELAENLAVTFEALAHAGASYSYGAEDLNRARLWADLGPEMTTGSGRTLHTDLEGEPIMPATDAGDKAA